MSNVIQPTVGELMKYADLQMAAEVFLADDTGLNLRADIDRALIAGNGHSSVFTATQADEFLKHWEILAQKANPDTYGSDDLQVGSRVQFHAKPQTLTDSRAVSSLKDRSPIRASNENDLSAGSGVAEPTKDKHWKDAA